jgi:hypothetical protein
VEDKHVTSTISRNSVGDQQISVSNAAPAGADLKTIKLPIEINQTSCHTKYHQWELK